MIKPSIYCKSAVDESQLDARKCLDSDGIELQLLDEYIKNDENIDSQSLTEKYLDILGEDVYKVKAVHVPLMYGEEVVCIEDLSDVESQELFMSICLFANKIAKINNEKIIVVIHNNLELKDYLRDEDKYLNIVNFLKRVFKVCKHIKIGIENVVPFKISQECFSNGCLPTYTDFIRDLRMRLNTNKVGSVLDTCHAINTIKIMEYLNSFCDMNISVDIEDYYESNMDICLLVHLCNIKKLGYNKGEHGVGFDENSAHLLKLLLKLHNRYIKGTPITLEVREEDYTDCMEYKRTKIELDKIYNE